MDTSKVNATSADLPAPAARTLQFRSAEEVKK
ncbi:hypothetical protein ABH925_006918 [Streptacidiphilus sp. EB129]